MEVIEAVQLVDSEHFEVVDSYSSDMQLLSADEEVRALMLSTDSFTCIAQSLAPCQGRDSVAWSSA